MNYEAEDEAADDVVEGLQEQIDELEMTVEQLETELESARALIVEQDEVIAAGGESQVTPMGDDELRALAGTVRTAQRNGHPDWTKHLDNLLRQLGA